MQRKFLQETVSHKSQNQKVFQGFSKERKKKRQDKHFLSLDDYGKQGSLFIFFSFVCDFEKKNGVGFNSFSKGF